MYVDDEPDLLEIAQIYFEDDNNYKLDVSNSAADALKQMHLVSYNAVISDYQMPGIDGIDFLKKTKEVFPNTVFILFTGKGREEIVIEAINNGADYYIQKGGDARTQFVELKHKLRKGIEKQESDRTIAENEQKYRALFNASHDAVAILDYATIIECNDRGLEMFEVEHDDLPGIAIADISPKYQPDGMLSSEKPVKLMNTL